MTIKDIARLSGYAVGTVSRVLNDSPGVSPAARTAIMAVVEEHNFKLNSNAKHLKQQAGTTLAIIVKGTQNLLFARILEQAQTAIQLGGYGSVVYYLDEDADEVQEALRLCAERKPLAILFLGADLDCFEARFAPITIPCALLTNTASHLGFDNLSSFTTDDRAGAQQAVEHLITIGHRQIGIIGGNWRTSQISHSRLQGCEASFAAHGIGFDRETHYQPARYSMAEAYDATCALLEKSPGITAIFAMSDVMAMGTIRALHDKGKAVPGDISVMGYDGISLGQFYTPRLATIQQNADLLAQLGVDLLLTQLRTGTTNPVHQLVPFQVISGESVAPLPPIER